MRLIGILLMLVLLMPSAASAHIVNDQNLYEDIEYSTAKTEIVYLNGLGILVPDHGNALFSPKDKLQRVDLAYLTGRFHKAAASNASPDEVAAAAVEKGYVPSLEGNATYGDVNQAFFPDS